MNNIKNQKSYIKYMYIYYIFSCFFSIYGKNETSNENRRRVFFNNQPKRGIYQENSNELENTIITNEGIWSLGTIKNIDWNCPIVALEDISKKFDNFKPGKIVSITTLKYILLYLKKNTNTEYQFVISPSKENKQFCNIILKEKKSNPYLVKNITINGNSLLTKDEILESISDVVGKTTLVEMGKFLILNRSANVIRNLNISSIIVQCVQNLGYKKLLLDIKIYVDLVKNEKTKTIDVIINIEEGSKYFIDKVNISDKTINIDRQHLNIWLEKHGLENGNFNHLLDFLKSENIFHLNISYIINNNKIEIFLTPYNKEVNHIVGMISYHNFKNININYIRKNLPISIGDYFDEKQMEEFLYKISKIIQQEITYKTTMQLNKKLYVVLSLKDEEKKYDDIISFTEGQPALQYKFENKLYSNPGWSFIFTPKVKFMEGVKGGLFFSAKHIKTQYTFEIINGEFYFDLDSLKQQRYDSFIRSLKTNIFCFSNSVFTKKQDLFWTLTPIIIRKNFHTLMVNNNIRDHLYFYTKFYGKKLTIFGDGIKRTQLSNFISGKIFYGNTMKLLYNPEIIYPLTKNMHIYGSLRFVYNGYTTNTQDEKIFLHLHCMNKEDQGKCLLWDTFLTAQEMSQYPKNIQHYLYSKNIILSNFLINFKLMFNIVLLKLKIPQLGKIQIMFSIFFNTAYDQTNNLYRFSSGIGILGTLNKNAALFALGKKYAPGIEQTNDLDYGLSFAHHSF